VAKGLWGRLGNLLGGGARVAARRGGDALKDLWTGRGSGGTSALTVITDLAPPDHHRMDAQRALVLSACAERWGVSSFSRAMPDVPLLQRALDEGVFSPSQRAELRAVGVVLGDVLETELGLRWVMVMDENTGGPALRWKSSSVTVDVCHVVTERAQQGRVDLNALVEQIRAGIRD
jgi:hypothetical protein